MQNYNVLMPSPSTERNFQQKIRGLAEIVRDNETAKHMKNAMRYLVSPILMAPENITEAWKRDPASHMHNIAQLNKLRYNSITGPLRFIHLQSMFCHLVNEKLAAEAEVLMHELQSEYRQMLIPYKLAFIRKVDKLIMRYLIYINAQAKQKEVCHG